MLGPPLLIGEKIFYSKDGNNVVPGTVKWLGKILECFGNQMVAGLALVGCKITNASLVVLSLYFISLIVLAIIFNLLRYCI